MNRIFYIEPYRAGQVWAFDDESRGLKGEPFVGDVNRMIDKLVESVATDSVTLLFSGSQFPGYTVELEHVRSEHEGNWYYCKKFDLFGWLCPALFKYFENAPSRIYVQVVPTP